MKKCLYTGWLPPPGELEGLLRSHGIEMIVEPRERHSTEPELVELVRDADATLVSGDRYGKRVIESAPKLKIIARTGVGYDNVDVETATARGVFVTIAPIPELAWGMAEHTFGLILSQVKKIPQRNTDLRSGTWDKTWRVQMDDLYHLTLGLLGVGRIGAEVAKRAKAFGMPIIYHDLVRRTELEASLGLEYVSFEDLLSRSDILSIHVPLTSLTRGIIDRKALGRMKKTAVLVNTARGAVVDEDALADALRRGELGGACIDVFTQEPLSPTHVFYQLGKSIPNLIITPHAGTGTYTLRAMFRSAAEEIVNVLDGGQPKHAVNTIAQG